LQLFIHYLGQLLMFLDNIEKEILFIRKKNRDNND